MCFSDNLFKIIENNDVKAKILFSDNIHPVFLAHFPTKPILPGFLHIDIACKIFNIKMLKIKRTKFLNIIEPNTEIIIIKDKNKITFLSKDNKKLSEINYE